MPTVTVIQPTMAEEKNTMLRCAAYAKRQNIKFYETEV